MVKHQYFILDTNVILDDLSVFYNFAPKKKDRVNHLIIPLTVFGELDNIKKRKTSEGYYSRQIARTLEELLLSSPKGLREGISITENYILQASTAYSNRLKEHSLEGKVNLDISVPNPGDREILRFALRMAATYGDDNVELVTNDTYLILIANAMGLKARRYQTNKKIDTLDDAYKGWRTITVPREAYLKFERYGIIGPEDLAIENPFPNEYFILLPEGKEERPLYGVFKKSYTHKNQCHHDVIRTLIYYENKFTKKIDARNPRQQFAMDALRDPDVDVVTLLGVAGTAKTFLATEAAFELVLYEGPPLEYSDKSLGRRAVIKNKDHSLFPQNNAPQFKTLLLSRPRILVNTGEEPLAARPGNTRQKMDEFLKPFYDQISIIAEAYRMDSQAIDKLWERGVIQVQALDEVKGRSPSSTYFVIDEFQNARESILDTLMTRPGEGTKLVLTGDPMQTDIGSAVDNALIIAHETLKPYEHAAGIYFLKEDQTRHRLATWWVENKQKKR